MDKRTRQRHLQNKKKFCNLRSVSELCLLLKTDKRKLELLANQPPYKTFTVPKKDGGERLIEAPGGPLKKVQGVLNRYLQSAYYLEKSAAAHGFVVGVRNDDDRRNVLTNAQKHLGKTYLLNIDLRDFFHSVTRDQVLDILLKPPFKFKRQLPDLLADLLAYNGRLPMGAPTSPVLSNFACRELDRRLYCDVERHAVDLHPLRRRHELLRQPPIRRGESHLHPPPYPRGGVHAQPPQNQALRPQR